ncbi:hypothetical protein ZYGR_0H01930 [Zygosaccharomyces rouxii]|uniref:ZYRO0B08470p n=2 Tax=Zygosaccharomyces rouxii TaxID=4956 RepID=C5DRH4_ZYGRC|nr:uncharacterized protein ZYRO0B08470g [Zygosaccharomyces rouxii]KAH9200077.1 hypothetical protein LQ764DRAFT_112081 [Zygosaccharomyces rouxii]GAV47352.1 hypothetical protein ZYGR_0H01930 [Zygosaccharomyces rouxii]CAR26385.1 ZYRO0B08470p [Zygosaccharomyces rouxii]
MARHPVVHGVLSISGTFGAAKGFQKLLQRYLSNEWLFENEKDKISPTSLVPSILESSSQDLSNKSKELDWTGVLSFVVDQIANVDVRLAVAIVVLAVMGPVLPYAFGYGKVDAASTESEIIASHLDPAQRALLQFGKSKSEPVLFGYVSMELDELEEHGSSEHVLHLRRQLQLEDQHFVKELRDEVNIAEQLVQRQESKELEKEEEQEVVVAHSCSRSHSGSPQVEESDTSADGKPSSSTRSEYTLPSAQTSPLDHRDSCVSHSNTCIQLSPIKTSNLDAQLTSEQAYSQPFTY